MLSLPCFPLGTKELVGIQIKIQIAGSVGKFAVRTICNNSFTNVVSMYSDALSGPLQCQLTQVAVFRVKQLKVVKR